MMGPEGSNLKFSENYNDMWALDRTNYKQGGYFVDLGAADGIVGSNTYLLEKFYKWNGICIEANPMMLKSLCGSRDVNICDLAVYSESGKILPFKFMNHAGEFYGWQFRSGISSVVDTTSVEFSERNVFTITLNDILALYNAPQVIDYVSIDIEGSELFALQGFDFTTHNVMNFTIEYNNEANRQDVYNILINKGYTRIDFDQDCTEDRYILER